MRGVVIFWGMHVMKQTVAILAVLALAACEGETAKDMLGMSRAAPDEFVVVSRPPLSVPPEFTLEAPDPTKQGPRASTREQARTALIGEGAAARVPGTTGAASSVGSGAFGDPDDAGWGSLLEEGDLPSDGLKSEFDLNSPAPQRRAATAASVGGVETSSVGSPAESSLLNKVGASKADPSIRTKLSKDAVVAPKKQEEAKTLYDEIVGKENPEPVIDAKGEAERLRKNKDTGKKPNEGKVVEQDPKKSQRSVFDVLF